MIHADLPLAIIALAESQSIFLHVAVLFEPLMARIDDLRRLNDNLVLISFTMMLYGCPCFSAIMLASLL